MSELGPTITKAVKFEENGTFLSKISVNFQNACAACIYGFLAKVPFLAPFI
jgi:hypothetical protein